MEYICQNHFDFAEVWKNEWVVCVTETSGSQSKVVSWLDTEYRFEGEQRSKVCNNDLGRERHLGRSRYYESR